MAARVYLACGLFLSNALSGCVSYQDIRDKPPTETRTYGVASGPLGECVLNRFALRYSVTTLTQDLTVFTRINDGTTIHLAATVQGLYWWDLALVPIASDETRVEARPYGKSLWGKPNYPADIWDEIGKCVSAPKS